MRDVMKTSERKTRLGKFDNHSKKGKNCRKIVEKAKIFKKFNFFFIIHSKIFLKF